jgi:hypothetical protein
VSCNGGDGARDGPEARRGAAQWREGRSDGIVTTINSAPIWVYIRTPSFWREGGLSERGGERRNCEAHPRAEKEGELMYQDPRWLRGFDVSPLTANQGTADRS